MSAILFSPHNDDAVLFASFLILEHDPHVITVLRSCAQADHGVSAEEREEEDVCAMETLGVTLFEQWPEPDVNPDWDAIRAMMRDLPKPDLVIAPAWEKGGHEQHNEIARLVSEVFITSREVVSYLTYTTGGVRSTGGRLLEPQAEWLFRKHSALACYQSQARTPSFVHFIEALDEYVLP